MTPEKNKFLEAALFYSQRMGWPVFPVKPRQKQPPLTKHGCLDASRDENQIRLWWEMNPQANVATAMGEERFALDVDPKKGGEDSFDLLQHQHGRLRDTLRQTTGGGGFHLIYQQPPGQPIPNGENVCGWSGIDVRGKGGYIMLHPSIHPNGREYIWDTAKRTILEEPISPADDWLIAALRGGHKQTAASGFQLPERIPHGQQHKFLVSLAGKMRSAFCEYDEIVEALWQVNQNRCEKPGPREHIEQYARSVCNYPAGPGRGTPPPPPETPSVMPDPQTLNGLLDLDGSLSEPLVEGLLPRHGLALMTGAQRSGKTIFAAQTAIAIARNQPLFDYYRVNAHGPVIIMEKDDPAGALSFKDQFVRAKVPRDTPIFFWGTERIPIPLGEAFLEWLSQLIPSLGAALVVLDSYTALRAEHRPGSDIVLEERRDITGLDELAKRLNCLILLLHHESVTTRSNSTLDWDARGAGTFGMTMAAECQIAITRYRDLSIDAPERFLRFRSRHMREEQLTLRYDADRGLFEFVINGGAAPLYAIIDQMKRHMTDFVEFTARDMEEPLGLSRATAFRYMAALLHSGAIWKISHGTYRFAPDIAKMTIPAL